MIPDLTRRTAMKAVGVATALGLASNSADASAATPEQRTAGNRRPNSQFEVELEINGKKVTGWSEIQLPANRSKTTEEQQFFGRTEWDDLTMSRGMLQADMALWNWRKRVIEGKVEDIRKEIKIRLLDTDGAVVAKFVFEEAWPKEYSPPDLDASAVGGDSAMGQEEITIAYEKYKRTK